MYLLYIYYHLQHRSHEEVFDKNSNGAMENETMDWTIEKFIQQQVYYYDTSNKIQLICSNQYELYQHSLQVLFTVKKWYSTLKKVLMMMKQSKMKQWNGEEIDLREKSLYSSKCVKLFYQKCSYSYFLTQESRAPCSVLTAGDMSVLSKIVSLSETGTNYIAMDALSLQYCLYNTHTCNCILFYYST